MSPQSDAAQVFSAGRESGRLVRSGLRIQCAPGHYPGVSVNALLYG